MESTAVLLPGLVPVRYLAVAGLVSVTLLGASRMAPLLPGGAGGGSPDPSPAAAATTTLVAEVPLDVASPTALDAAKAPAPDVSRVEDPSVSLGGGTGTSGIASTEWIPHTAESGDALVAWQNPDAAGTIAPRPGELHRVVAGEGSPGQPSGEPSTPATIPYPSVTESEEESQVDDGIRIWVPYRTQWDGSTYEWGNCGVASISMAMEYYGHSWSTHTVRESINGMTGNWDTKIGVDWRYLKLGLEHRGFAVDGPYNARGGYQYWTLDDLVAETQQGRPVILLVHYRSLPGHEDDEWFGDHYIVFLGLTRDGGVIYHDAGLRGDLGAYRVMDQATLDRAWSKTWIGQNRTAMTVIGSS